MRRLYSNVHIGLITALLLAAVAFEAGAVQGTDQATLRTAPAQSAGELR